MRDIIKQKSEKKLKPLNLQMQIKNNFHQHLRNKQVKVT